MSDDNETPDDPDKVVDLLAEPNNLVDLFAEPKRPDVGARGHRFDLCKHKHIDLVMKKGLAECRACEQPVDLFQWLYANTEYFRRAHANYRATKRSNKRLAAEEKELKRSVTNLKAQSKRWAAKLQRLQREAAELDPEVAVLDCKRSS